MADWPQFRRAPITEALLDIRAKLPAVIDLPRLATFQDAIKDRYPRRRERFSWQGDFRVRPGGAPEVVQTSGAPDGYLFESKDGHQIVQARLDGFTFNRLKPYDRWESLRDEAKQHWDRYRDIAKPEVVSRLALRYINRVEIPLPIKDFREYVLTTPEIAPSLPQGLASFFMQLVIPDEESRCVSIITETIEPAQTSALPLIFDIDVYREGVFDPQGGEIWDGLEQLREVKNRIFFKSMTEKAKELFK